MGFYTYRNGDTAFVPEREIVLRYLDRRYRSGAEAAPTLPTAIIMSVDDLPPSNTPALPARPASEVRL